jgi:hypothetical protein
LLKTELYERMAGPLVTQQLNEFAGVTAVDPRKDVIEFAVALTGGKPVVLVEGRFDVAAIEKRLSERGVQATSANGAKLWSAGDGNVLALPSRSTAVIGSRDNVNAALASTGLPPALAGLLPEVATGAQLWAISTSDFKNFRAPERSNLQNLETLAGGLQAFAASADLRFGLQFRATGFCSTPEDAVKIQTALRGLMGLARLSASDQATDALKALDSVIVKPDGKLLRFAIDVTAEQLDALQKMMPRLN